MCQSVKYVCLPVSCLRRRRRRLHRGALPGKEASRDHGGEGGDEIVDVPSVERAGLANERIPRHDACRHHEARRERPILELAKKKEKKQKTDETSWGFQESGGEARDVAKNINNHMGV